MQFSYADIYYTLELKSVESKTYNLKIPLQQNLKSFPRLNLDETLLISDVVAVKEWLQPFLTAVRKMATLSEH